MKLSLPIIGLVVILRKSLYLVSQLVDLVLDWCFSPRWPASCTRTLFCKVERHRPCQHFWKKVKLIYEQGNAFVFLFVCLSVCFFFFCCCCCCFFFFAVLYHMPILVLHLMFSLFNFFFLFLLRYLVIFALRIYLLVDGLIHNCCLIDEFFNFPPGALRKLWDVRWLLLKPVRKRNPFRTF